jgi:preprotein translocase subunit SecD
MSALLMVTEAGAESMALGILDVHVDRDRSAGAVIVSIRLADDSKRACDRFTRDNVGHRMKLRLDSKTIVATVLREPNLWRGNANQRCSRRGGSGRTAVEEVKAGWRWKSCRIDATTPATWPRVHVPA